MSVEVSHDDGTVELFVGVERAPDTIELLAQIDLYFRDARVTHTVSGVRVERVQGAEREVFRVVLEYESVPPSEAYGAASRTERSAFCTRVPETGAIECPLVVDTSASTMNGPGSDDFELVPIIDHGELRLQPRDARACACIRRQLW